MAKVKPQLSAFRTPKEALKGKKVILEAVGGSIPAVLRCVPNPDYNKALVELSSIAGEATDEIVNQCLADHVVVSLCEGKEKISDKEEIKDILNSPEYWALRQQIIIKSTQLSAAKAEAKTKAKKP